ERLASIPGSVPDPFTTPPGCSFHPRCTHCMKGVCDTGDPPVLTAQGEGHAVACHLFKEAEEQP
ncbi:MAG: ABC transporter ATP-binding protein, partial [Candidatus Hydrogenedentes bacterium]|nr:ABC transporter ATP-binding protein [Candidatus Hydrogenedentota bacterium]